MSVTASLEAAFVVHCLFKSMNANEWRSSRLSASYASYVVDHQSSCCLFFDNAAAACDVRAPSFSSKAAVHRFLLRIVLLQARRNCFRWAKGKIQ